MYVGSFCRYSLIIIPHYHIKELLDLYEKHCYFQR